MHSPLSHFPAGCLKTTVLDKLCQQVKSHASCMRLHHLIQYSCGRFCCHLLLAKGPWDNNLFTGINSGLPRAIMLHGGETQHFWAMKYHMKENQSPYFSLWSLPPHVTMSALLWEPPCWISPLGKVSRSVLLGICLTVPTSFSGGAALAVLTLIPSKGKTYKLLKSLITDYRGTATGKLNTQIIKVP